jgi:hypothetical protein
MVNGALFLSGLFSYFIECPHRIALGYVNANGIRCITYWSGRNYLHYTECQVFMCLQRHITHNRTSSLLEVIRI